MSELLSWGLKGFGWLARWSSFELRVARQVTKQARARGQNLHPRSLRKHLYATRFVSRLPDINARISLREELARFVGNREAADRVFEDLQAAVIARSTVGDAVGSATVAIGERIDVLAATVRSSANEDGRWEQNLDRMRLYRAGVAREIAVDWPMMRRVVAAVSVSDSGAVLREWARTAPRYLEDAPALVYAWLGDLAAESSDLEAAEKLLDRAIDGGAYPVGFWAARRTILRENPPERGIEAYDHPLAVALRLEGASDSAGALAVVRAWEPETTYEEIYRDAVLTRADYLNRDYESAIKTGNRGRLRESTAATLWWARALMAREIFSGSELYKGDTSLALDALIKHRDSLRGTGHDSGEVVSVAATAAQLLNNLDRAVSLATAAPDGEATTEEADNPLVRAAGAIMLAQNGDTSRARLLVAEKNVDESVRCQLSALIAREDGDIDQEIEQTTRALEATEDFELKGRLAYNLALHGVQHPFVEEQELLGNDDFSEHLRMVAAAARDEPGALEILRAGALGSTQLGVSLAEIYARRGDTEAELRALENAAALGNDADLWMLVAGRQFSDRRLVAAKASLAAAIAASTPTWGAAHRARALQLEVAVALEDWPSAISFAEALVRVRPNDERAVWTLVACLYFGGETARAIEVWRSAGEFAPRTRQDVAVWVGLCQSEPSFGSLNKLHQISHDWQGDEEIRRNIVGLVLLPPKAAAISPAEEHREESDFPGTAISAEEEARNDILREYFRDFPDGGLRQISIDFEGDSVLDQIAAAVGERPDTREFDDQVFSGAVPLGMSSEVHGGSYLEAVISCASGIRFVGHSRANATPSVELTEDSEVVLDTTAVYALSRLPEPLGAILMSAMTALRVSDAQYRDAVRGLNQISRFGHAGPNVRGVRGPVSRRLRPNSGVTDREAAARVVANMRKYRRLPPTPGFGADIHEAESGFGAWFDAVLATGTAKVLWVDDAALGGLARALGVRAFTTLDLVRALRLEGRISEDDERTIHSIMVRERYSGVPFDVRTYSEAFEPTPAVAAAVASLIENGLAGSANEIFEFIIAGAGALSSQQFSLEMWLSAATRWLVRTAPDSAGADENLEILARRIFASVWLVRSTFPFIDMGIRDGVSQSANANPLIDEARRRFKKAAIADHGRAARELLDLTAGVDPDGRVQYTRIALS